ncbi:MAG: ribosome maturation factor RimP [Zhaonellaceae bacterium]|jgi:ribosome maturation factor RimP|nr:ribosome maturation factor RimP [Clostridia bacterium]
MVKRNIESKVEELVLPIIEGLDFELVDVQYAKEGPNWYLRIFIDHPEGIDLDDCEIVSRKVESALDEKDLIKNSYILEVSSPGIERPLKYDKDFIRFIGELVVINTYKPINGKKTFKGYLQGLEGQEVIIKEDLDEVRLSLNDVSHAHLAVDF